MVRRAGVFAAGETMTPDIAAALTQRVEGFQAKLHLICGGKRVRLDSLIGILSLDCFHGMAFEVTAEGGDAQAAAEAVAALLEGRA